MITKNTRAIMVTNPCNPTGVVLSEDEMRMIADIAKKNDLFLISDEVYREFCYDDKFGIPTMGRFKDINDNLVIIDSVSKRFSACVPVMYLTLAWWACLTVLIIPSSQPPLRRELKQRLPVPIYAIAMGIYGVTGLGSGLLSVLMMLRSPA